MESSSNELAQKLEKCQKECAALSQENSMLIEQGEETVMLLKKAKCDYEQLKEKHDADIRESARNFKDEINQYVVLFVKLFLMIFFGMKNFS